MKRVPRAGLNALAGHIRPINCSLETPTPSLGDGYNLKLYSFTNLSRNNIINNKNNAILKAPALKQNVLK